MTDTRTKAVRGKIMKSVKTADTGPEMTVRRMLHRLGYRYRLHAADLPGRVDLYFPSRRKAIFVHGCFWHGHSCKYGRLPKSRLDYWAPKIAANKRRDRRNLRQLQALGVETKVVWQCQLRDCQTLKFVLVLFLDNLGQNRSKKQRRS